MRYMLVDRVMGREAGASIHAVKNVAVGEDFLEYHFPRFPVMPGSLILEAAVQMAGRAFASLSHGIGGQFSASLVAAP